MDNNNLTEHEKQARNAYMREWRKKNPYNVKEYLRQWIKKNPDKVREYQRRWLDKLADKMEQEEQDEQDTHSAG